MKKIITFFGLFSLVLTSCTTDRDIPSTAITVNPNSVLVHYWNFNSTSGTLSSVSPDYSLIPSSASIDYIGSGAGYLDSFSPGYDINARNNDVAGSGIRARNPSDTRSLLLTLPTTGYNSIVVQFATAATSSGATTQNYSYTIDGTNFITTGLTTTSFNPSLDPTSSLVTLDFSAINGVNNNPNFKVKIDFAGTNASGISGNNRFDNVTLVGVPVPNTTVYLLHYWNFNNLATGTLTSVNADFSLISASNAIITYPGSGAGYMDQYTPASILNAQNSDAAGLGLRFRNPSDTRSVLITAPTTGYKNVVVKFATARSSTAGASIQNYSYSIDGGTTFITTGLSTTTFNPNVDPTYDIVTLDFSSISGANNNPNFVVKINFCGPEATGTSGNNRIDNVTFQANQL